MNSTYRITQGGFSYTYQAENPSKAIQKWLRATFVSGCKVTLMAAGGSFTVGTPKGMTVSARIEHV